MVVYKVVTQVMPVRLLLKFSFLALVLVLTIAPARADFLMCRDSASASELRKTLSSGLLRYLEPLGPHQVRLTIQHSDEPNAFALHEAEIIVTTALLDTLRSSDEEAFVLGHEVGHIFGASHSGSAALVSGGPINDAQVAEEEAADRFAANLLNQKGMDCTAGVHLLARLQAVIPSPSLPQRQAALAGWVETHPR